RGIVNEKLSKGVPLPTDTSKTDNTQNAIRGVFTATTFLSALLLFSVQPLFAKMVLPLLGGSSSVWAVALLFFQGALLVGYGYAHLLVSRMPVGMTGLVHLTLTAIAFSVLPIGIPSGWTEPPLADP